MESHFVSLGLSTPVEIVLGESCPTKPIRTPEKARELHQSEFDS